MDTSLKYTIHPHWSDGYQPEIHYTPTLIRWIPAWNTQYTHTDQMDTSLKYTIHQHWSDGYQPEIHYTLTLIRWIPAWNTQYTNTDQMHTSLKYIIHQHWSDEFQPEIHNTSILIRLILDWNTLYTNTDQMNISLKYPIHQHLSDERQYTIYQPWSDRYNPPNQHNRPQKWWMWVWSNMYTKGLYYFIFQHLFGRWNNFTLYWCWKVLRKCKKTISVAADPCKMIIA